jgi:hypothetical protein
MSFATRARTGVLGVFVSRAAAVPPASGASVDLFSTSGLVLLTSFFGLVTVAIPAESIDFDLALDPDDGGSDVALGTTLAVDSKPSGTWITINPTTGGALLADLDVSDSPVLATPYALETGDIKLNVAGGGAIGTDARVSWGLTYIPLSADGAIAAV